MPQFFKLMVSVFTVIFSIGTTADSAGFECEKASTEIEKTICNDPYLSSLDEILNDLYFLKASINIKDLGFVHDDGTVLNFLEADTKSEQLEWINNDRAECFDNSACLTLAYLNRISSFYSVFSPEPYFGWSIQQTLVLPKQKLRVIIWSFDRNGYSDNFYASHLDVFKPIHYLVTIHDENTGNLVDYNTQLIMPMSGLWYDGNNLGLYEVGPQSFEIQTHTMFTYLRHTSHVFSIDGLKVKLRKYNFSEFSRVSGEEEILTLDFQNNYIERKSKGVTSYRELSQTSLSFSDTNSDNIGLFFKFD